MKKTLPFCRRLIMSLFLFTIAASSWAYDFEVDGIYYNKTSENTVEVTYDSSSSSPNKYLGHITIPEKVTWISAYTVTAIGEKAFRNCSDLTSVTIPNSVASIGNWAFDSCSGLTSITIPNSVTSIGDWAFDSCSGLTSITIPNSVTSIGDWAFDSCSGLTSVTIPNSVTSIGCAAFANCSGLTSVKIPNSVTSIDNSTFSGCSGLTSVTIPNSVTSIDNYAFSDCSGLTSVKISNSVTSIGNYAFSDCSGLTSVTIPNSVTNIGKFAFYGCGSLEYIEFYSSHALSYLKELDGYGYDCTVYVRYTDLETAKLYYNGELLPMERFYPEIIEKTANMIKFKVSDGRATHYYTSLCNLSINGFDMSIDEAEYIIQCQEPYQENEVFIQYYIRVKADGMIKNHYYNLSFTLTSGKPEFSIKNENTKQGQVNLQVGLNCNISTTDYEVGCVLDSTFYKADTDSIVVINKLTPGKQYTITPYVKYNEKTYLGDSRTYTTESIEFYCEDSRTQSSFSVKPRINNSDGTALPDVLGFEFNGTYYSYEEPTWIKITGLTPNNSYSYRPYAEFNGEKIYGSWKSITTRGVSPYIGKTEEGVTTLSIFGSYKLGDATLDKAYFAGYEDQGERLHVSGLNPNTEYSFTFYVKTKEGSTESVTKSFTTSALEWETLPAEATSNTVALICAKTNIADEETGTGFEWRRYDAPDLVPSTKAPCPVVDGVLTGALRNLSANTYYKFRPYYTSATGETYYGDWSAFGTADAYVYFDPTVRTYEASTVSHNSAKLKGYAIAGSDDIVEQGFEYRTTGRSTAPMRILTTNAEGDDVQSVIATGQWMNVTLENLQPGTTYTYRAYVKTAKATTYGEELSFTTMEVSGIGDMDISEDVTITAIYTLDGRRIASPQPGVNIVHYSDGSVRKVIVR